MKIPLHCLILGDDHALDQQCPAHERIDIATITQRLVGSSRRHDLQAIMFGEVRHQVALKLSLGERAVVSSQGLTRDQQKHLATGALGQGAEVYLVGRHDIGIGQTISPPFELVSALPVDVEGHLIAAGWQGITVIGDVHGELEALDQALAWARTRRHFVWLLGDVIDYGRQPMATALRVHHAVMRGEAAMVLGNHERKIARWLDRDGENIRISDGNRVTIDALERLSPRDRSRWMGSFRALLSHTTLSQQIGHITLMHAAAHPSLWHGPEHYAIEQFALYGESDQSGGRYRRTHRWVDEVPSGQMVIVGHDIISEYPMIVTGAKGGKVVFLDTGSGKGGRLSSADLRFTADGLKLECFKRH